MRFVLLLLRQSWFTLLAAVLSGLVSGFAASGLLAVVSSSLTSGGRPDRAVIPVFVGLCILAPLTRVGSSFLLVRLGEEAILGYRLEMSRRILATPLLHLERLRSHRLLAVMTEDLQAISAALVSLTIVCTNAAIVIGCLIYLAWLSPVLLAILVGLILLGAVGYRLAIRAGMRRFRQARRERDTLLQHVRTLTEAVQELQLHFSRRKAFLALIESVSKSLRRLNISAMTILSAAASTGQMLFFVLIGILLFLLSSQQVMTPALLTGYTLTLLFMMSPLQVLLNSVTELGRAGVAVSHLEELGLALVAARTGSEPPTPTSGAPRWKALELCEVVHTYHREGEEGAFQLGPISLTFRPRELVFLVGGNGSGKTTFSKLLTGLYMPESGEIRLDGVPLTEESREQYWQHFTMIPSEFFLFDSLLGLEAAALDERAFEYLVKLKLDHKVEVKDGVFSTTDLSRGQRKRLALLTAWLEDRSIYVFDEWAADQDPIFKDIFYRELLPELRSRGKTVIVISHDDKYFDVADRILKLVDGRLECEDMRVPVTEVAHMYGSVSI